MKENDNSTDESSQKHIYFTLSALLLSTCALLAILANR